MIPETLGDPCTRWQGQVGLARKWYKPHLERRYDYAHERIEDLEQFEQIAATYSSRQTVAERDARTR